MDGVSVVSRQSADLRRQGTPHTTDVVPGVRPRRAQHKSDSSPYFALGLDYIIGDDNRRFFECHATDFGLESRTIRFHWLDSKNIGLNKLLRLHCL